ncbi:flavin-containing monooxygenase [Microbacterium karelineae]|uniref:flavin-containing monooxygenase n=1 Tax=Microbacterium karelineae TaxID=2654283 RepID=UPI001E3B5DFA|nr:NAD(P)/FAD-dependent oxidoreductase [Microbacterium karelineae]
MLTSDIDRFIKDGELIPLLCAVAELTGDRELIDPSFRPRLEREMVTIPEHAGLDPETARTAYARAAHALRTYFDSGAAAAEAIPAEKIIDFLTAGDGDHAELMRHELGDVEEPGWAKAEAAPGRSFVVGIVGAGQSGLAMASSLRRLGIDFVMFEAADRVGGTWRWNAYPGCRLDTSTLAYSFSFFQRNDWNQHFAVRETLEDYFSEFADREGLSGSVRFRTRVTRATWLDGQWQLAVESLDSGDISTVRVDALVSAVGFLNQAKIPDFPGLDDFRGETVHSAEWHPDVEYRNKRVSVIGTGASAYQIAPAIVDEVSSLTIYQRSAPWMLPAPLYQAEVTEGRRWLMENVPSYHRWLRLWEVWHSTIGKYALAKVDPDWTTEGSVSEPNQRFRDALVANVRSQYEGREDLLDAVIPTYPVGVKRMLRDNGVWARTLKQSHTELVTAGIESFDADGIRTVDGVHHPADLVVFATGFYGTNHLGTVEVIGRDGQSLRELWGDESRAYNGITVPGFPNLFCLNGPNTGLVAIGSQTFMTESALHYVSECLRLLLETGSESIEPTEKAYREYIDWIEEGNRQMAWGSGSERSWYRNARGTNTVVWPYSLLTYYEITRHVSPEDTVLVERPIRAVSA